MNITAAMKLRNKLKSRLDVLQTCVKSIDFELDIDADPKKAWPILDGATYEGALDEIDRTRDALSALNLAIEKANEVNRLNLNELHSLESHIAWEQTMVVKARSFVEKKEEFEGDMGNRRKVVKLYQPVTKRDFVSRLAGLRKRRDEIEEAISKANGSTEVAFVLPEGIKIY